MTLVRHGAGENHPEQYARQHDGRGIVEQAFALNQHSESLWRAKPPEDSDHRDRVGGAEDGSQQQCCREGNRRGYPNNEANNQRREQQPGSCQDEHRSEVLVQLPGIEIEGRFKNERGQKDVEDQRRRNLQVMQHGQHMRIRRRQRCQADADQDQHDRKGQLQAPGHGADNGGDQE